MASMAASATTVLQFLAAHPAVPLAISLFLLLGQLISRRGKRSLQLVYFPVVGMLPSLLLNLHRLQDWITSVMEEQACTFQITGPLFSGMSYLFTADPENVKYVTSTNFGNFVKGSRLREVFDEFGDTVTTSDFDDWRIRRRVVQYFLHRPEFLRSTRRVIHEKVEGGLLPLLAHFAQQGGEKKVVDMREVLQRFTFDVMCRLIFGVDLGSLSATFPTTPFLKAVDDVFEASFLRFAVPQSWWKLLKWLRVGPEKKLSDSMETIHNFVRKLIAKRNDALSKSGDINVSPEESDAPFDLLTCFIGHQLVDETGRFNSDRSIEDHTLELLTGGKDSTSLALSWFFWAVSLHPSVETKILGELTLATQADGGQRRRKKYVVFDAEELDGCVYLNAAIHESLRLFPAVPVAPRWALRRDVLPSGHKVQPGTMVMFCAYATGRMEKIWGEDRLEFKPERWISSHGKLGEESSYKFPGFGAGPRICLGKSLAFAQIRAVAAAVIYNFRFEVAEGHQVCPRSNIVLHMKNGLKGHLRERYPR